jgi:hypothetical protein
MQKHSKLRAHGFAHSPDLCDISLGSLKLPTPEAGQFVELILLHILHALVTEDGF